MGANASWIETGGSVQPKLPRREIFVLFTTVEETVAAVRSAAQLVSDGYSKIQILAVRVVPYPLPIDEPDFDPATLWRMVETIVQAEPGKARIQICLGRDAVETLLYVLRPRSLLVIGARRSWWPSYQQRWARRLAKAGHQIVFALLDKNAA